MKTAIQAIEKRLAKRSEPQIGSCMACGHEQEMMPSRQPMATVIAEAQWRCQKCGGQIQVTFTTTTGGVMPDEDIQTLLTAWADVSSRLQQLEQEKATLQQVFRECHKAASEVCVNYGLRARCGDMLGLSPDPLSKEVLEAREEGASEVSMAILRIMARVDPDSAQTLAFIEGDDDGD